MNGRLTLGENIGDLGGLAIAYEAYQRHVATADGGKAPVIDGYTGEQRFFLAWAQLWRDYTAPDMARQNLLTDPHSPSEFRVRGTVRNFDPWYAAFGVKEGDKLYLPPDKRVKIWRGRRPPSASLLSALAPYWLVVRRRPRRPRRARASTSASISPGLRRPVLRWQPRAVADSVLRLLQHREVSDPD